MLKRITSFVISEVESFPFLYFIEILRCSTKDMKMLLPEFFANGQTM